MKVFDPPILVPPGELWNEYFGKPDGIVIRLRCRLLGHRWERCTETCCMGTRAWCARCNSVQNAEPSHA